MSADDIPIFITLLFDQGNQLEIKFKFELHFNSVKMSFTHTHTHEVINCAIWIADWSVCRWLESLFSRMNGDLMSSINTLLHRKQWKHSEYVHTSPISDSRLTHSPFVPLIAFRLRIMSAHFCISLSGKHHSRHQSTAQRHHQRRKAPKSDAHRRWSTVCMEKLRTIAAMWKLRWRWRESRRQIVSFSPYILCENVKIIRNFRKSRRSTLSVGIFNFILDRHNLSCDEKVQVLRKSLSSIIRTTRSAQFPKWYVQISSHHMFSFFFLHFILHLCAPSSANSLFDWVFPPPSIRINLLRIKIQKFSPSVCRYIRRKIERLVRYHRTTFSQASRHTLSPAGGSESDLVD